MDLALRKHNSQSYLSEFSVDGVVLQTTSSRSASEANI